MSSIGAEMCNATSAECATTRFDGCGRFTSGSMARKTPATGGRRRNYCVFLGGSGVREVRHVFVMAVFHRIKSASRVTRSFLSASRFLLNFTTQKNSKLHTYITSNVLCRCNDIHSWWRAQSSDMWRHIVWYVHRHFRGTYCLHLQGRNASQARK
jgi:hypothetical protein